MHMTESPSNPSLYRVVYSELVRARLKTLLAHANLRGMGQPVLLAVKEIDRRLQLYPQFGEPFRDLQLESAQLWIGIVPPLVARYCIYEKERLVMVVVPFLPLPNSGLDP